MNKILILLVLILWCLSSYLAIELEKNRDKKEDQIKDNQIILKDGSLYRITIDTAYTRVLQVPSYYQFVGSPSLPRWENRTSRSKNLR